MSIEFQANSEVFDSPLKSIYILRDGLPVFHREFSPHLRQGEENEMLVSGFLSALVSFMKDMKEFGEMKELMTSSNLKFSFLPIESLVFVACTNGNLNQGVIERFLRSISMKFLHLYQTRLSSTRVINPRKYDAFESIIQREMLSNMLRENSNQSPSVDIRSGIPALLVPPESIQHEFYFKGDLAERILPHINGENNVESISRVSGVEVYKVHAFLKYLVKIGIVDV
ncbi:MAG: hypothetical protein ACFFCS_18605 [Candidatus Hodarchaeota archaeon]